MTNAGPERSNKIDNYKIFHKTTPELPYYANRVLNIHNNGKYEKIYS